MRCIVFLNADVTMHKKVLLVLIMPVLYIVFHSTVIELDLLPFRGSSNTVVPKLEDSCELVYFLGPMKLCSPLSVLCPVTMINKK